MGPDSVVDVVLSAMVVEMVKTVELVEAVVEVVEVVEVIARASLDEWRKNATTLPAHY